MISKFFTTSVAVNRTTWVGDEASGAAVGTIMAHLQQTTAEETAVLQMAFGLTYTLLCSASADIRVGDTLTIASGVYAGTYNVRSTQVSPVLGMNQHMEVIIVKDK